MLPCPICGEELTRRRPAFPGEQPRHANLPAGCPGLHATSTDPARWEAARLDRLATDVMEAFESLEDG